MANGPSRQACFFLLVAATSRLRCGGLEGARRASGNFKNDALGVCVLMTPCHADDISEEVDDVQAIEENIAGMTNVQNECFTDGKAVCTGGSACVEGDLGVYCECYKRRSDGEEVSSSIHVFFGVS